MTKLEPGELAPFVWNDDNTKSKQVDPHARLIGLPAQRTTELYDFTVASGLMDAFWRVFTLPIMQSCRPLQKNKNVSYSVVS